MSPTPPQGPAEDADATAALPRIPEDDLGATKEMPAYKEPRAARPPYAPPPPVAPGQAAAGRQRPPRSPFAVVGWIVAGLMALFLLIALAALLSREFGADDGAVTTPSTEAPTTASAPASPSPSPSLTPSPSATPTPTPPPSTPPAPDGPTFTSFEAPSDATCPNASDVVEVTIAWTSQNAARAWIGVATNNAKAEPYAETEVSDSVVLGFPCSNNSQQYTVTLEDADGTLTHWSVEIASGRP